MIRLGLRLALATGRGRSRMALTAFAVGVGVVLLLTAFAVPVAHDRARARELFLTGGAASVGPASPVDALRWRYGWMSVEDGDRPAVRVAEAVREGPAAPSLPGGAAVPAPGTMLVSSALRDALRDEGTGGPLARRLPFRVAGPVPRGLVPAPDDMIAIVGRDLARLPRADATRIVRWTVPNPSMVARSGNGFGTRVITVLTPVVILVPIAVLVASAARIGRRRRDEQLAALRLMGASTRQLAAVAGAEALGAAGFGALAGLGLFAAVTRTADVVRLPQESLFAADLAPPSWAPVAAVAGLPLAAGAAALVSAGRVLARPLAIRRGAAQSPAGAWGLVPLVLGWTGLAGCHWLQTGTHLDITLAVSGTLLTVGVVLMGPWLVRAGARLMLSAAGGRPAVLIGGRRLLGDSAGGFRAVTGVAAAAFVLTSVAVWFAALTELDRREQARLIPPQMAALAQIDVMSDARDRTLAVVRAAAPDAVRLRVVTGSDSGVAVAFADCPSAGAPLPGCRSALAAAGMNVPRAITVTDDRDRRMRVTVGRTLPLPDVAQTITGAQLVLPGSRLPVGVRPDAVRYVVERRTLDVVAGQLVAAGIPFQASTARAATATAFASLQRGMQGIVLLAFVLGAVGLAAGASDALAERRRELARLHAAGVSARTLRTAVAVEHVGALLVGVVAATAAGLAAGATFVVLPPTGAGSYPALIVPWSEIALIAGLALLAGVAVLAATAPAVGRVCGPESLRAE